MAMSDYLEGKLIQCTYNGVAFTPPTEFWIGLFETDPTDAGGGIELSGGGYLRRQFTPTTAAGPLWIISNDADVTFPTATVDWNTINFIGIFDGVAGNLLDYGPITTPRTVLTDGVFKILAGELDVQYT